MAEMSGYQVFQAMRVNAKGTRTMDAAAQSARELRENLEDRQANIRKIEADIAGAWKGGAAEQAMKAAQPMWQGFDDTISTLQKHENALSGQSGKFNGHAGRLWPIHQPQAPTPNFWDRVTIGYTTDHEDAIQNYTARSHWNETEFKHYHGNTEASKSELPAMYLKPESPTSKVDAVPGESTGGIAGGGTPPPQVGSAGGYTGAAGAGGGYGAPGAAPGYTGGGGYVSPAGAGAAAASAGSGGMAGPSGVPGYSGAPAVGGTSSQGYAAPAAATGATAVPTGPTAAPTGPTAAAGGYAAPGAGGYGSTGGARPPGGEFGAAAGGGYPSEGGYDPGGYDPLVEGGSGSRGGGLAGGYPRGGRAGGGYAEGGYGRGRYGEAGRSGGYAGGGYGEAGRAGGGYAARGGYAERGRAGGGYAEAGPRGEGARSRIGRDPSRPFGDPALPPEERYARGGGAREGGMMPMMGGAGGGGGGRDGQHKTPGYLRGNYLEEDQPERDSKGNIIVPYGVDALEWMKKQGYSD